MATILFGRFLKLIPSHIATFLAVITMSLPVYADLEDSFQSPNPRAQDLRRLVETIRSLQARDALPQELEDLVARLDSVSDLVILRNRLIALLPDVTRQDYHKNRRQPIAPATNRTQRSSLGTNAPSNSWGDVLWLNSDSNIAPSTDLWLQTWHNDSKQTDDFFEYTADADGWMLGLDRELTASWILGVSIGRETGEIDSSIFGSDDVNSQTAAVALTYVKDRHSLSFSWQHTDSETDRLRVLFIPTTDGIRRFALQSDFDTQQDAFQVAYGTYFEPTEAFSIAPFLSASYGWLDTDDYIERGGDALSLVVETDDEEQILGTMGVTLSWTHFGANWTWVPSVTALVEHDFKSETTTTLSRFSGTDTRFITNGHDLSETRWRGAASISALYRDRASLSLAYEVHVRDDYDYDGVILTAQLRVD